MPPINVGPAQKASLAKWGSYLKNEAKKDTPSQKDTGREKEAVNPNMICFWCHNPGHYASDCKVLLERIAAYHLANTNPNTKPKKPARPEPFLDSLDGCG